MGLDKSRSGVSKITQEGQRVIIRLLGEAFSEGIADDTWKEIENAVFEAIPHRSTVAIPPELTNYPLSLNAKQAAEIMGIHVNKMYDMARRPGFPVLRDGGKIIIPRDAFWEWYNTTALSR